MPYPRRATEFAAFARELAQQPNLPATLQTIVEYAVASIEPAEDASITVKRGTNYATAASTGPLPEQVDAVQYRTLEGPCLDALNVHHVFRTDDLATDVRWPVFGPAAASTTAVISMMSHRLFIEGGDSIAALNLYSRKPAAFVDLDTSVMDELATHAAIALTTASVRDENDHLRLALTSNREIGVAIGVLMTRQLVTKAQAFDLLRIASQHLHRKLSDVAAEVTDTGTLPGMPAHQQTM